MNFSASSSVLTFFQSARSADVRKYASGPLSQSLYLESCASAEAASARPATAKRSFFTIPPTFIKNRGFYSRLAAGKRRVGAGAERSEGLTPKVPVKRRGDTA